MKYLKYYFYMFKMNSMDQMANKENFFVWFLIHFLSLATSVIFFGIIFSQTKSINGWNFAEVLLVLGTGSLVSSLGSLTFFPFMYDFPQSISNGDFDLVLLKPLNAHFLAAFCWVDMEDFTEVPLAVLIILYAVSQLHVTVSVVAILSFLILIISSLVIIFSIISFVETVAFKHVEIRAASNPIWSFVSAARFPAKSIKGISLVTSLFLIPIAIISSVPAQALIGKSEASWVIGSLVGAAILFVISRKVFSNGLKQYSSASS